jgi:threonyl-tRNA synthetase
MAARSLDLATDALSQSAVDERNIAYKVNEGNGAFYRPKIEFHLQDSLDRPWHAGGTIQLIFRCRENLM